MGYTKLFNEIIMSTVWREPDHVRILWITMLAIKGRHHVVSASLPGLADAARITFEQCQDALNVLSAPDKYSRSTEHDGRRIEKCDGGWFVLNGEKYRNKMSLDERREYNRIKQREYRANKHVSKESVQKSTECRHTDTDTETDTDKNKTKAQNRKRFVPPVELGIDSDLWDEWMSNRKKAKAQNTPRAIAAVVTRIKELQAKGHDPQSLVETANASGWKTVYEPRENGNGNNRNGQTLAERLSDTSWAN
jgi:hypothetical protein